MTAVSSYQNISWNNVTTFSDMLTNANQSGAGWLFFGIDILVFLVMFITLTTGFGWEVALITSAFISLILSILFAYMGVLSWTLVAIPVGIIVASIMYIIWSNKYD